MNKKITEKGKAFIKYICTRDKRNDSLIRGNNGIMPYVIDPNGNKNINIEWVSNAIFNNDQISNNIKLYDALIFWFEKYGNIYEIDPNILAAQAYIESGYKIWIYTKYNLKGYNSTASGISQFTMKTVYQVIQKNNNNVNFEIITQDEKDKIFKNIINFTDEISFSVSNNNELAQKNRYYLHQNIIDNPDIMIKAQARYLKYIGISSKSQNLTSVSLFGYNRGPSYAKETYTDSINKYKKKNANNEIGLNEGLNYVLKIFGVLGDKNNEYVKIRNYKPKNFYFGYDNLFKNIPSTTNINSKNNIDKSKLLDDFSLPYNYYKFNIIKFNPSQYFTDQTNKNQIVLHHTVSGGKWGIDAIKGDINHFYEQEAKIAVHFIISRDGTINQLFSIKNWGYHLGIPQKTFNDYNIHLSEDHLLDKKSISIEIDSWGPLLQDNVTKKWYPTTWDTANKKPIINKHANPISEENIVFYKNSFRGFNAYEKYTNEQIYAVKQTIFSIKEIFNNIELNYHEDMWDISINALNGTNGIWTHVSYRKDKSDCHPQPELIQMLKLLSQH